MIQIRNILTGKDASETGRTEWQIAVTNLLSFFNLILFSVGVILIVLGRYNDAFITVSTGLISAFLNTLQEVRAKRQLDRITLLVRPVARVIRNGSEQQVDPAQVVEGDILHLVAGDQAMADGIVRSDGVAEEDESMLTGESALVRKQAGDRIFSGSFCVTGDLTYQADAVGAQSFAGQLTAQARTCTQTATPLQQQVTLIIRLLMVLTVVLALLFYIGSIIRDLNFLQGVEASAVLIGLIPYGLFLTITLAYTLGAITLARGGAIVQQTNAVESLHYVDVLCLDKTGTLTTNSLQLQQVQRLDDGVDEAELNSLMGDFAQNVSMPNATINALRQRLPGRARPPVDEVRFASLRKWSALAFADAHGRSVFVLGAPEILQSALTTDSQSMALTEQTQIFTQQGLRVLLFAYNANTTTLHDNQGTPNLPALQPLALIVLRDELRPRAGEMLRAFGQLGVRVKIISGDSPHTVAALAKQIGIVGEAPASAPFRPASAEPLPRLVSGPELAQMSSAQVEQAAEEAMIFGRIAPEQKAQLVEALMKRGHYVAMIGDGINDILALKKAQVGIAMQSGSSATRNVAAMVLLNDSYAALSPALAEGKRIINGLTNATSLLLARAFTYAFVIIGALAVGLDFPFEPAQAGVTAITVGLPSFFLTLWAHPGAKTEPLLVSLVRFVLPVAMWSMLIGVVLYAMIFFRASNFLQRHTDIPPAVIARFEQYLGVTQQNSANFQQLAARIDAQTTLSVFLSLCALLLILFLEPPVAWLACWRPLSPDRRPTWLALGLSVLFIVGLYTPAVANYLGFLPPFVPTWRLLLGGVLVWVVGLRLFWRYRWMERLVS